MASRRDRPPVVLPLGRDALSWVRSGGPQGRGGWPQRIMSRWQCLWFERNLALQRLMPPERTRIPDPVFILGLWRSGTTYLHDLLGGCPGMFSPSTSQCLNPASFRLRPQVGAGKSVRRPMDGMAISTLSPQEDEFALLALGVPSVYRGFLDPRRLAELTRWLNPDNWTPTQPDGWAAKWTEFLAGVADGREGRIVLKSPGHTFRLGALQGLFPNAAYIWLVRDAPETFLSNRKMWLAMFDRYALWGHEPPVLDSFLSRALEHAAECIRRAVNLIPADRLAVVHFEQLTRSTLETLERLTRRLSLGSWEVMRPSLESAVAARSGHRPESYDKGSLPSLANGPAARLHSAQLAALSSHGIDLKAN
jgi:omega-hydroxy-beta-dihydromenaquinone-9 sulfotransferase